MIARPIPAVTTLGASGEPEPRHDRPADAPQTPARPRQTWAGWFEDEEERDNQRGFERDETDQFHRLVRHLLNDGDRRAAGRRARRTLGEMVPGAALPPLLVLNRPRMNDACAICGVWACTGKCWQNTPGPAGQHVRQAVAVR